MAYDGHNGVKYSRWEPDISEETYEEPKVDTTDATLDELYFESYSGELNVTVETPDGYVSIQIPVKADRDWNEFVGSLPTWD